MSTFEAGLAPIVGRATDNRGRLLPVVARLVASTILPAVLALDLGAAGAAP